MINIAMLASTPMADANYTAMLSVRDVDTDETWNHQIKFRANPKRLDRDLKRIKRIVAPAYARRDGVPPGRAALGIFNIKNVDR